MGVEFNKNWARWIFASISVHFGGLFLSAGVPMFVEGYPPPLNKELSDNRNIDQNHLELRIDGPWIRNVSKGCYWFDAEVNILVGTLIGEENFHIHHQNCGIAQSAFKDISVFQLGDVADDPENDQSFLGCLRLKQAKRDEVRIAHFGMIEPTTEINQSTVEGHYEMNLLA